MYNSHIYKHKLIQIKNKHYACQIEQNYNPYINFRVRL